MFLQNISKFISNYRYEQATAESITVIKAAFLDYFGVTYRGINEQASQIACYTIDEIFKGNSDLNLKASVIGTNYKTDVLHAAFVNGVAAHVLELDDGHRGAQIHLGSVVFSTALAIAESHDLTGKEFIEGVMVGYEIGILLGKIVNPQHRNNGFHTTGTIGAFVAGAVASKLLKLDDEQILLMIDDCFIRRQVNVGRIYAAREILEKEENLACLNFEKAFDPEDEPTEYFGWNKRKHGSKYEVSLMCGLWKKDKLIKVLERDCDPWTIELEQENCGFDYYINSGDYIIDWGYKTFQPFGIQKGRWTKECIDYLHSIGFEVN